jgi:hypothetical protein
MTRTTLASIEAAHKKRLLSKTIIRKGGEKLMKQAPRTAKKLP